MDRPPLRMVRAKCGTVSRGTAQGGSGLLRPGRSCVVGFRAPCPEVFVKPAEHAGARCQDALRPVLGPVHAGLLEPHGDGCSAACLHNPGTDRQALCAEVPIAHALAVCLDVGLAFCGLRAVARMCLQRCQQRVQAPFPEFRATRLRPRLGGCPIVAQQVLDTPQSLSAAW